MFSSDSFCGCSMSKAGLVEVVVVVVAMVAVIVVKWLQPWSWDGL